VGPGSALPGRRVQTDARHQAVDAIAGWTAELDDEVVHTAELVISELVTTAVRHAGPG